MSSVKVAYISTSDMALRYLLCNQLRSLQAAGYEVVGISSPGPHVSDFEAQGFRHIAVPMTRQANPLADLRALWDLYWILRRGKYTIVHTHTPKAGMLGQYAALLARVPIRIHTIHGLYFPGHMLPKQRWRYVLLERATMLFSQLNLSVNPEDIPIAIRERICIPERIRFVGNGIDLSLFDPAKQTEEHRQATRARLGLSRRHKIVGMVARFVAEKGYLEMLQAVPIIKQKVPDARFLFIGPIEFGKSDSLDPSIIERMGLRDIVQFLGHRTDLADLYAIMDLVVLPSHREGFPGVPMEAAAMGVPAVVTDVRGCRQTVTEGVTGHLVPVRDPRSLAEAILDLLCDEPKRRAFGHAAREKALAEFDERLVFARLREAYQQLLLPRSGLLAATEGGRW